MKRLFCQLAKKLNQLKGKLETYKRLASLGIKKYVLQFLDTEEMVNAVSNRMLRKDDEDDDETILINNIRRRQLTVKHYHSYEQAKNVWLTEIDNPSNYLPFARSTWKLVQRIMDLNIVPGEHWYEVLSDPEYFCAPEYNVLYELEQMSRASTVWNDCYIFQLIKLAWILREEHHCTVVNIYGRDNDLHPIDSLEWDEEKQYYYPTDTKKTYSDDVWYVGFQYMRSDFVFGV